MTTDRDIAGWSSEASDGNLHQMAEALKVDNDGGGITRAAAWQHAMTVRSYK
ncbi:hypothetical protein INS49_012781 [Diaporthe citri]|uniref:uncharacterized protein n=1 Tax=Diaporthe citri TaxID=83186 RepID=UPI001C81AEF5|nr:uncharacterized protein INS49_012781 [Diaporthe citri]KAG6359260.1 hypothetical protein INS49_012781 [Diaporthe citri]